jgi:hypothetical protein
MNHYELSVAMVVAHLAELRRHADQRRLARRLPGRTAGRRGNRAPRSPWVLGRGGKAAECGAAASGPWQATKEPAMLLHHHEPGVFDPDHCRTCARQAGLLDHYHRVQHQQARLEQAHRHAHWALWSSGAAVLLAVFALLSG